MARTAEDLALLYRIIAGPDARDTDLQPVPVEEVPALDVKGLRIAYALTFPGFPVAAEIRAAVEALPGNSATPARSSREASLPELDFHADLQAGGALIGMMLGAAQPDKDAPPPSLADYFAALQQARPLDHRLGEFLVAMGRAALPGIDDDGISALRGRSAAKGRWARRGLLDGRGPWRAVQL